MIYVGIDVASNKHDCFIMNDNAECYFNSFTILNNIHGYKKLHQSINDFVESTNDSNIRIGLESTGHYSNNILLYFIKAGFKVSLINPILTNMDRKSNTLRKTKTDKIDSRGICIFLDKNRFNFKPYTLKSYHTEALKSLSRQRYLLVKQLTIQKITLTRLVSITFPEYLGFFSKLTSNSSLDILKQYSIPSVIASTRIDVLTKTLKSRRYSRYGLETATKLKEISKTSIGNSQDYYAFQIKSTVDTIRFLQSQIDSYELQIENIVDQHYPNVLSIPGVGKVTSGLLIGEIGDISNFKSADSLLAYAGLDPSIYQSGNYDSYYQKPSKRGSSYFRWAIHQACSIIIFNDKTFSDYYHKKKSQGKHHLVCLGHVSKKFIRVLFNILKYNSTFIPQN